MTFTMKLHEITDAVKRHFLNEPPNGWLLGWSEERLFREIQGIAAPFTAINHTSFDYCFCNWYDIHANQDDDDDRWILSVKLSFIVPVYCIFWTTYEGPTFSGQVVAAPKTISQLENSVRDFVEDAGFFKLPAHWHDIQVAGVSLELGGEINVTLDKCLFCDYSD